MARIELISEESFRTECEKMDDYGLISQILIQYGAAHALMFLQELGVTPERVAAMAEQVERNAGVVSQIAAAKGIDLPILP